MQRPKPTARTGHAEPETQVVARLVKNKSESIVVGLGEFMSTKLVHIRIHYQDAAGQDRPTARGVCVNVERLPELRAAIEAAEAEAIRQGLIDGGAAR